MNPRITRRLAAGALVAATALAGTAVTADARPASTEGLGPWHGCQVGDLCLWTGYNFTGTMHRYTICREEPIPYTSHSWANQQTGGAVATFRDIYHRPIRAYGAPNHDGDSDSEGVSWAEFVKVC